jgi:mannosyltransferase OCH1-like enzyme
MNIIQTWKTKNIPEHYQYFVKKVKDMNPTYNYMFFDDNDIVDFIQNKMPEYYNVFAGLTSKIQQIDFFRYLAIYYYGGLYLDLDIDLDIPIDDFSRLDNKCIFPVEIKNVCDELLINQKVHYLIGNYAFYSSPGHPFIKKIIDNIVSQRINESDIKKAQETCTDDIRDVYVYYRTGPILVTQTYVDYLSKKEHEDVLIIEPRSYKDNCFGDYGRHCCYGSWRSGHPAQTTL